ncbi:MAG: hypothetical protein HFI66_10440 [Lachnospiraceae bacterium]|jgi:hypothetical protein|nr:hypothetical protein [Lachnospiraceae bacterium]
MKEYEIVWEIFNQCANNQMRDVFIEEAELASPEEYVKEKFGGKAVTYERELLADGTEVFHIDASGIKERCTFTEI